MSPAANQAFAGMNSEAISRLHHAQAPSDDDWFPYAEQEKVERVLKTDRRQDRTYCPVNASLRGKRPTCFRRGDAGVLDDESPT